MDEQDEDFWVTYIASTPKEDADFAGFGCGSGPAAMLIVLALVAIAWVFLR
jgi:uncharacterized protein (TIGR03382 family)